MPELQRIPALPAVRRLLSQALCCSPALLFRFRQTCPDLQPVSCQKARAAAAQARLTRLFALELLREKAPPLYDALPWNAWDTGFVASRYRLWRTKVLVQGEQAPFTAARLLRTAGLYVLETSARIRRYIETKCEMEGVRNFCVLEAAADSIPLADRSVDLAVIGPSLGPDAEQTLAELGRVADGTLLLLTRPGTEDLIEDGWLAERGFTQDRVRVADTTRPCWWRIPAGLTDIR
ncbi:MAG: hypothetical protein JSU73_10785 [candidate division WOR-3 bacterium]|nr:MAG: hypothetical protein JSU73_10785 [candidate division WOR-3 bacterium]